MACALVVAYVLIAGSFHLEMEMYLQLMAVAPWDRTCTTFYEVE